MNAYYEFMLNKKKYNKCLFPNNNLIPSQYKSSSYITNTMNDLKNSNFLYNVGISLAGGFFYGIISTIIDETITKKLIKDSWNDIKNIKIDKLEQSFKKFIFIKLYLF